MAKHKRSIILSVVIAGFFLLAIGSAIYILLGLTETVELFTVKWGDFEFSSRSSALAVFVFSCLVLWQSLKLSLASGVIPYGHQSLKFRLANLARLITIVGAIIFILSLR